MANISSYDQLSSWNEDDDLLFVQQPDAPKKAHPSQMKEYILRELDVPSVGGSGKYISAISETDGKINAVVGTMDDAPTEGSENIVSSGGVAVALSNLQTQINTLNGDNKTIIPANADINNIQYTAVGQYITNGSNKNIQNVPNAVKNLSFYMNVINSLTNESAQISSAWKERIQIIIPIDASAIYIREVKSNASASDIMYGSWQTVLTDKSGTINYTASDITELNASMTINEFSLRKWGRVTTLGMNFNLSSSIPVFTNLFKLPSGITGFGRSDAIGIFISGANVQAALNITASGYVLAGTSMSVASNYQGQITFIGQ